MKILVYKIYLLFGLVRTVKSWPLYLINNFLYHKDNIVTISNNIDFHLRSNSGDMVAVVEDFYTRQYIPYKNAEFVKDWVVIDVGAHIGTFAILAVKVLGAKSVFAYEPDKVNFLQLQKNIQLNSLNNIYPQNVAIWKCRGELKLYYDENLTLGSFLVIETGDKFYKIPSKTINDILDMQKLKFTDLLKLDIEGAEYEVILNMSSSDFKRIRRLFVEYHDREGVKLEPRALVSKLKENDFIVFKHFDFPILYAFKEGLADFDYIDRGKLKKIR